MKSTSFACSFAFTGTTASPAHHAAYIATRYSGEFFMKIATRSPGARPMRPRIPPASRAARSARSP